MGHLTIRSCSRCGKSLEDAASMEVGIGPICRKLDNALLAQLIEADFDGARSQFEIAMHSLASHASDVVPHVAATIDRIANDLAENRSDWRTTVKRVEYVLSFAMPQSVRDEFIAFTAKLGYTALAHVWTHQGGVAGKARIYVGEGRIYVQGPRNRAAVALLRKVTNRRYHADEKVWSAPLANAAEFACAVRTGYPLHVVEGFESWDALLAFARKAPTACGGASSKPPVTIKVFGGVLVVTSPFNSAFVSTIKSLPSRERAWKGGAWEVHVRHRDAVVLAAKNCYGAAPRFEEAAR